MQEIWKPVEGYENYFVSNLGKVKRDGIELHPSIDNTGYMRIGLNKFSGEYSEQKKFLLHRLVAETFISNPENKPEVNHIDGNKQNNCVSNLEWVTRCENVRHASKNGLMTRVTDEVKHQRKISGEKLKRFCRSRGLTQKDVSNILEISLGTVQSYYTGKRSPKDYMKQRMKERLGLDINDVFYNSNL